MKISKKLLLLTFLASIFLSIETIYAPAHVVSVAHAAPQFNCQSEVFYEDDGGGMHCITDKSSPNNNSVSGFGFGAQQFGQGDFGYRSEEIYMRSNVGQGYEIIGQGGSVLSQAPALYPLIQYTASRKCTEQGDGGNPICECPANETLQNGGIPECVNASDSNVAPYSTLVTDPVSPRIDSVANGAMCVYENLHGTNDSSTIVVCNSEVDQICQNDQDLRAGYDTSGDGLYFWCNQETGNGADKTPVVPNHESPASPPVLNENIPPLDWCYTDGSGQHKTGVGSDLLFDNPTYTNPQAEQLKQTSHVSNGVCDITQYVVPGESGGIQNCVTEGYRVTHVDECECEFNVKLQQGTGNTYTAIGCVPSTAGAVVTVLLSVGIGLGAFFTLIFIIIGGFQIMTNSTNPDEIKEGQQKIVNAVLGLLLIIFSVVLLRIIGVDVLGLGALGQFI